MNHAADTQIATNATRSIIIPAHNESVTIARSLDALLADGGAGLQIIVVCNGCSDNTAEIVEGYGDAVTLIESEVPSKTHALNLGDDAASVFPRFYMDADVVMTRGDIERIADVLDRGDVLAAAPTMRMDLSGASWPVRAYYRVWQSLPYTRAGLIGVGVYALGEAGRSRFGRFPDIVADDGYVRALYEEHERSAVEGAYSVVTAPRSLRGLIAIKTRSRLGGYELQQKYPGLLQREQKDYGSAARALLRRPRLWPCVPAYLLVNLWSRARARRRLRSVDRYQWERDDSSRTTPSNGSKLAQHQSTAG